MDCGLREKNAVRRADRRTDVISRPDWTGMGMSKRHKGSMVSNSCNGHTERSSESGEELPLLGTRNLCLANLVLQGWEKREAIEGR